MLARNEAVLNVTHQQLADELGSVREIISRLLKGFADLMKCGVNYNIADKQWPKITEELNTQLGNAMFGKVTAAEALDNTAAEADKLRSR